MANKVYKNKTNDFAILGLVFSIISGLPGLIFSIIGLNQIKKTGQNGKGMCIAGIIINVVWLLLSIALIIFYIFVFIVNVATLDDYYDDYDYDYSYYEGLTDYERCTSYWTECDDYSWECEEDGCWCTYDDGDDYDYFWCDSWDFE